MIVKVPFVDLSWQHEPLQKKIDDAIVEVMKILTNEQAPQYSIRYHLNEQTLLRGSSDFNKDSRGSIEFEKRF